MSSVSLTKLTEAGLTANTSYHVERLRELREALVAEIRAAHQLQGELARRGTTRTNNDHQRLTQAVDDAEAGWRR